MSGLDFIKMHGLGNDFVILDLRARPLDISTRAVQAIARRRTGVGCDQLIAIDAPVDGSSDAAMRIWNADGGEVDACGNATRCVGYLLLRETGKPEVAIETGAGVLVASGHGEDRISVDMGMPRLDWADIPLAREMDTASLDLVQGPLKNPVAVNMGNPHAVFFVEDADAVDLAALGPVLEHDDLFPERANIGVAEIHDDAAVRLRVWERGVGLTQACGTGACAAIVAGVQRGLLGRAAIVTLDGGELEVEWRASDNHVIMAGPVGSSFSGTLA